MKYKLVSDGTWTTVFLAGKIDEHAGKALAEIRGQVATPNVLFQVELVDHINSIGISQWVAELLKFAPKKLAYSHCPPMFATTARVVPAFLGEAPVFSMLADFFCDECEKRATELVTPADVQKGGLKVPCKACGTILTEEAVNAELYRKFGWVPA